MAYRSQKKYIKFDYSNLDDSWRIKEYKCFKIQVSCVSYKKAQWASNWSSNILDYLRTFLNGTKIQQIPSFSENNELINEFMLKSNQFDQQYTTGDNQSSITETMRFETEKRISTFRRWYC